MFLLKLPITYLNLATLCTIATFICLGITIPSREVFASPPPQTQTKANEWFSQGLLKVEQKDYAGALIDFSNAIASNPNYADAYYQRGLIYALYAQGKPVNRDGTVPGCQKIDEYRIICKLNLTSDWKRDNKQKAMSDFDRAIALYLQASLTALEAGNYEDAAVALEKLEQIYAQSEYSTAPPIPELDNSEEFPIGSSTISGERTKSASECRSEGYQALGQGDLAAALAHYRQAARLLQQRNDTKGYQEVQKIITELENRDGR